MYVLMTLEEASKIAKKDTMVLVATSDLESENCCDTFERKKFGECKTILEEATMIAKVCDNFAVQIRAFSEFQSTPLKYENKGKLSTIILPPNRKQTYVRKFH